MPISISPTVPTPKLRCHQVPSKSKIYQNFMSWPERKAVLSSEELMELDNNFCWWRNSVHHANQPKGGLSHYLEGFVHPLCMTAYIKNIVCSPMYVFQSVFPPNTNLVHDFVYQLVSKKTCAIPSFAAQMPKPQSRTPNFLLLEMLF